MGSPARLYRTTSFYSMLFILLWMLPGIAKAPAPTPGLTRYLWFVTYIVRHALPVCWLSMCYVNRHSSLPPRSSLAALTGGAHLLTLFVLTNDLHRSVFVYAGEASASWSEDYWGYYLSLAKMALLIDKKTRQQQGLHDEMFKAGHTPGGAASTGLKMPGPAGHICAAQWAHLTCRGNGACL